MTMSYFELEVQQERGPQTSHSAAYNSASLEAHNRLSSPCTADTALKPKPYNSPSFEYIDQVLHRSWQVG